MIPQEIIQRILDTASITEVVSDYVSLKKDGRNYKACCPFHNEETASFVVSPAKGIFKCFGCGEGGNALAFIQKLHKLEFVDAIKVIAKKYNIAIPEKAYTPEEKQEADSRKRDLIALQKQNESFVSALRTKDTAIDYLKQRGITGDQAKLWNIGWSENGYFGQRITFPIQNAYGDIVGFTARRIDGIKEKKYLNSSESNLFKKSNLLYGIFQAKQQIVKLDKCYVVEGQMDCIAMHSINMTNTVAPSGTAFTVEQVQLIKKYTDNIVLVKDGDSAGVKSMLKDISMLLKEGINISIIALPDGEDPDSIIRKHHSTWIASQPELDIVLFKSQVYAKEIEAEPVRKAELLTEITNDIAIIPDKNKRRIYIQACSKVFGISENEINKDIREIIGVEKRQHENGKFFALNIASDAIKENGLAIISFDTDDVISKQFVDTCNVIGLNGHEVEKTEIVKLKKLTKKIVVEEYITHVFDEKRQETTKVKSLKKLFTSGFDIEIKSTDDIIDEETGDIQEGKAMNFVDWYIYHLTQMINPVDNVFTGKAIELAAEIISYLPESTRITKISEIQNAFKVKRIKFNAGDFKKILSSYVKKNAHINETPATISNENININNDQYADLNKFQHYFDMTRKAIYHIGNSGNIQRVSNFIIIPIIHSNTSQGHFKLFELVNEFNYKTNISLETKDLNDVKRFKCKVEEKGNFIFKGNQYHLDNIKERLYSNTTYSNELENLGWQYEGFWAWSSGISKVIGDFAKTDENGIIEYNGINYLIKPLSNLYKNDRTAYINEKKFDYKTSDVTLLQWSSQYMKVFDKNTMISICALLTTIYSDAIFKLVHGELPLINYFGPKGAGKTQQADSLLAFFGEKQPVNNLSKVTIYGLSQTMKSFHNAFVLIDEYKNSLDIKWIEFLKSIYNRQGKIQGNISNVGTKTEHIPVNSMALLCGQDLPTLDIALLDRCICLTASKTEFTDGEKNEYKILKNMEESGLAHLTDKFLKFRPMIIEQFEVANSQIQTEISNRCSHVSGRLQKNLNTILTPFKILEKHFEFPFTFQEALETGCKIINEQQKFIESADDLRNFWTIFQTLLEQNRIWEGRNYLLREEMELKILGVEETIHFSRSKNVMYLRWNGLYPLYAEYSRRSGMVALSEKTLQFYLEKAKYFIGKIRSKKFIDRHSKQQYVNDAIAFDYDLMNVSLMQSERDTDEYSEFNSEISQPEEAFPALQEKELPF